MSKTHDIDEAYRILRGMYMHRMEQILSLLTDALDRLDKDIPALNKVVSDLEAKSVADDATIADLQAQIAAGESADAARLNAQVDALEALIPPAPAPAPAPENPPPADEAPPV